MSSLALDIENAMRRLDASKASRLERLFRDALSLVDVDDAPPPEPAPPRNQAWLQRLEHLRSSVGTGKSAPSTDEIVDDLRSERC